MELTTNNFLKRYTSVLVLLLVTQNTIWRIELDNCGRVVVVSLIPLVTIQMTKL